MEKKARAKKKEHDFAVNAFRVVQQATMEAGGTVTMPSQVLVAAQGKNPNVVALGRLGGKKGGTARAHKLAPEQRREIARKAAQARWAKRRVE